MSAAKTADLSQRFNRWLQRFSPPRQIADKPEVMADEAKALFGIFLDHAPDHDWQDWWDKAIRALEASMTTRSWPAPGEVVRACRGAQAVTPASDAAINQRGESAAIEMLADWFGKFKSQMPGMGRSDRTDALIRRGVLRDEREARFYGFALSPVAMEKIREQEPSRAEWGHHVEVMARLSRRNPDAVDFELQDDRRRNAATFRSAADVLSAHRPEAAE